MSVSRRHWWWRKSGCKNLLCNFTFLKSDTSFIKNHKFRLFIPQKDNSAVRRAVFCNEDGLHSLDDRLHIRWFQHLTATATVFIPMTTVFTGIKPLIFFKYSEDLQSFLATRHSPEVKNFQNASVSSFSIFPKEHIFISCRHQISIYQPNRKNNMKMPN